MKLPIIVVIIFAVQLFCAVFFVSDIVMTVLGVRASPIAWHMRELLEIGAAIGLVLGVILGAGVLMRALKRTNESEERLRLVSSAFMDVVDEKFSQWSLTAAEKDVALFLLKGMSTQEIAALRQTSEGTVKAQTNAIYRKANVTGRPQFLNLFIDDLMDEVPLPQKSNPVVIAAK